MVFSYYASLTKSYPHLVVELSISAYKWVNTYKMVPRTEQESNPTPQGQFQETTPTMGTQKQSNSPRMITKNSEPPYFGVIG
jgi:hypothetical protein